MKTICRFFCLVYFDIVDFKSDLLQYELICYYKSNKLNTSKIYIVLKLFSDLRYTQKKSPQKILTRNILYNFFVLELKSR